MGGERVVDEFTQSTELDMDRLQPYDPTEEEQTWPTEEEMAAAKAERAKNRSGKVGLPAVPKFQDSEQNDDAMEGVVQDCTNVPIPDSDDDNADSDADMGADIPGSDED